MLNLKLEGWHVLLTMLVLGGMFLFTGMHSYNKGYDKGVDYVYDDVVSGLGLKKGQALIVRDYMFTYDQGFKTRNPKPQFAMNGSCEGCHGINVPRGTHKG